MWKKRSEKGVIEPAGKKKRIRVRRAGTHKKSVVVLWIVLIGSVAFGVYKNFTAVNTHVVHEEVRIETEIIDTNAVENFVTDFAGKYYGWENNKDSLKDRTESLKNYMTKELLDLNADLIKEDVPVSSYVSGSKVWKIEKREDGGYEVYYSVTQNIVEKDKSNWVKSGYMTIVKVGDDGSMVIIRNPSPWELPGKSEYEPEMQVTSENVDTDTIKEVTSFLETFFKQYPWAAADEMAYYVRNHALEPINRNYVFVGLVNPVFDQEGDVVTVKLGVKYQDQDLNIFQIPQYELTLEKTENWIITSVR